MGWVSGSKRARIVRRHHLASTGNCACVRTASIGDKVRVFTVVVVLLLIGGLLLLLLLVLFRRLLVLLVARHGDGLVGVQAVLLLLLLLCCVCVCR